MNKLILKNGRFKIVRTNYLVQIVLVLLLPIMFTGIIIPFYQYVALAACVMFVVTIPCIGLRKIDWFSIWNVLWYSTFVGVFLRSVYIFFDIPDAEVIQSTFLREQNKDFLLWPMLLVLCGITTMTIGYISLKVVPKRPAFKIFRMDSWSEKRLLFSTVILLGISWIGMYLFVTKTAGAIVLEKLSALRGVSSDLSDYNSYGYLRLMAQMSDLVCYISVAHMIIRREAWSKYMIFFVLSLLTSIAFNTFVSSRGSVLFLLINILAISYYLNGKKLNFFRLILVGLIALLLMKSLTILRHNAAFEESFEKNSNLISFLDPFILATNMIDVSKTGHIVAAIPKLIDYQLGQTIVPILVAWIPRELWREKPVVNVDNIIGMVVFDATAYGSGGVPAGIIAEMFLNFALPGVIIGCFIIGYMLKYVQLIFNAYSANRNIILIYVVSFMNLGLSFVGSSFNAVVIGTISSCLPLVIILSFITRKVL